MEEIKLSSLQAQVLNIIRGYKNENDRVSRETLKSLTRVSDDKVRQTVSELKKMLYPICSFPDKAGYFYTDDPVLIEKTGKMHMNYCISHFCSFIYCKLTKEKVENENKDMLKQIWTD